jgi:hypothetical protein
VVRPELPPRLKTALARCEDEDEVQKMIGKLPIAERIEAMVEILLFESFDYDYLEATLSEATVKMPKTMGSWARRVAPRILALNGPAETPPTEVFIAVMYALVRAGIAIDPSMERLLSVAHYPHYRELTRECVLAISEERREQALLTALNRGDAFVGHDRIALAVLADFPYPSIVRFLLAHVDRAMYPKKVLASIAELGTKHPAIAEVLAAKRSTQKPAPKLHVVTRSKPTIKELDANAKKQVEQSAKRFDDRKQSAADLLAGKGDEPLAPFERVAIADEKGKLAYEAWLHLIDAGSIYKAGTTKLVAQIIQDGIECDDHALRDAFNDVIQAKPKRKTAKR